MQIKDVLERIKEVSLPVAAKELQVCPKGGLYMDFIAIKLPKCTVYLTPEEIGQMLQRDTSLFKRALRRGKGISRSRQQKQREGQKWSSEKGIN